MSIGYFGPMGGGIFNPGQNGGGGFDLNQNGLPIPNQNGLPGIPGSQNGGVAPVIGPPGSQNGNLLPATTQNGAPLPTQNAPLGLGQNANPIEHVIANLGIHPESSLAAAFRAIHGVLMAHMAAEAARVAHATHGAHPGLGFGRPGGPIHPGPVLQ